MGLWVDGGVDVLAHAAYFAAATGRPRFFDTRQSGILARKDHTLYCYSTDL